MKIIDNRNRDKKNVEFKSMDIGTTFYNAIGHICLKISDEAWFNFITNAIVEVGFSDALYELVNAELVLKDDKEENEVEKYKYAIENIKTEISKEHDSCGNFPDGIATASGLAWALEIIDEHLKVIK